MKAFFIFFFVISSLIVSANTFYQNKNEQETSLKISNTISNQQITGFTEDSLGRIWISTIRGLNRFNGHEYHQYFKTENTNSISDNRIQQLFTDSKGEFWVATVNGVCRYNNQDCFDQIEIESRSQNAINLFENKDGQLFLNLNIAICAYNTAEEKFQVVIDSLDQPSLFTQCHVDKFGKLWVVKVNEVRCYDSKSYKLLKSYKTPNPNTYSYLDKRGKLWLISYNKISIFDTYSKSFISVPKVFGVHPAFVNAITVKIHPYSNSSILMQTQKDGIFLYNYILGTLIHESESSFPFKVPDFEITTYYNDVQNNLWIGSYDHGYKVIYSYKERFNSNNYLHSKMHDLSVTSIKADKEQNLFMITRSKGLFIYNSKNQSLQNITNHELFERQNSSFFHRAEKTFIDSEGYIWILSTWALVKAHYSGNELKIIEKYFFKEGVLAITEDQLGNIWLGGTNEKIYVKNKQESEFKHFHLYGKDFTFTPVITALSNGNIIVVSFNYDLHIIEPETRAVSTINILKHIHTSKFIPTCLFEDKQGDLWIGTITNGLLHYNSVTTEIEKVNGTSCLDISSITDDVSGNLWIGTLYGLGKFDPLTKQIINFYQPDGIGGNQFNNQSVCRLTTNELIFGGTHGISYFNPIDIAYKKNINLYFEDLTIHNEFQYPWNSKSINKHLSLKPNIELNHKQNSFTLSFSAIDYSEYERVKYAYKLEGFDKFWIEANRSRKANYSNIPAGKYKFRVKIYNEENTIIETENTISIKIKAAPWFSWYALLVYLILIILIVYFVYQNYRRIKINKEKAYQAEQDKAQEQKVNKMNMSFFSNLSHEFRTPLTMISGPMAILSKDESLQAESKKLLYIIQRSVNRMLRLVNQLMDFNKLENDTLQLNVKLTDVVTELKQIIEVFHINAREKGVEIKTYGLEDNFITWLDSDKLDKIMTNLISNALKFNGSNGEIKIAFDLISGETALHDFSLSSYNHVSQYIKVSVTDSGRGIPEDKLEKIFERYYQLDKQTREFYNWGTGIGLYYARALVELHHGYIKAENNLGGGAKFTFILPTDNAAYDAKERISDGNTQKPEYQNEVVDLKMEHGIKDSNLAKQNLLLIDDDTDIIHYLKLLLSPHYNITYKFDAESAYGILKDEAPDLILCDVVMPGMDGYSFCKKVKENPSYSHLPVILVTAKATVENQVEGLNTGADAYVTKPFNPSYLIALINSQLKNRERTKILLSSNTKTEKIEPEMLSVHDKKFMTELYSLMEKELSNSELNINSLTEFLNVSRTKFYYKVKGLTGENPNVFFKKYKLNRAAELILEGNLLISEVADVTGFSTVSHFSVSFKKQFGVSPSEYSKLGK